MRTIEELVKTDKHIYIYCRTNEISHRFLTDADKEGFSLGNGKRATQMDSDDLYAICGHKELCYCNSISRMCFQCDGDSVLRVDYEKFVNGDTYYLFQR